MRNQCLSVISADYQSEDLKWWNSTSGVPITTLSRLKIVNGKLFVTNLTGYGGVLYSNDGLTWTQAPITGLTALYDIEYLGGKYVASGVGGATSNVYYSSDLATWSASAAIGSVSVPLQQAFNTGSSIIIQPFNSAARRTTDGTAYSTVATLPSTPTGGSSSYYVEGTTSYLFMHTATTSGVRKFTSTDNGVTWSNTATNIKAIGNSTYPVPHSIYKFGATYYCIIGIRKYNDIGAEYGVYTSTDLVTFSPIATPVDSSINSSDDYATIFLDINGTLILSASTTSNYNYAQNSLWVVLEGTTGGYIGTQEIVPGTGESAFVRIA